MRHRSGTLPYHPALVPLLFFWSFWGNTAAAQTSPPIKVTVEPRALSIRAGQTVLVIIRLRDADNHPAAAPKPLTVSISVQPASGPAEVQALSFETGQAQHDLSLNLTQPGIVWVRAKESELREGGALIKVRPPSVRSFSPPHQAPPAPVKGAGGGSATAEILPSGTAPAGVKMFRPGPGGEPLFLRADHALNGGRPIPAGKSFERPLPDPALPAARPIPPVRPVQATQADPPLLTLLISPATARLADGKDAATVTAFLSRAAERDTVLNLFSDGGHLSRSELKFPRGEDTASCTLTSLNVGAVKIRVLGSDPPMALAPDSPRTLTVKFVPPVVSFVVRPSPPRVSLMDQAYFDVQLLDEQNRPIVTDTERKVCFVMDNGNGEITPVTLSIPAGRFENRAAFLPEWLGPVGVTASTPSMLDKSARLDVSLPLILLALSLLGGLLGGGIAYLFGKDKKLKYWRIAIGGVTGFVFYWLCLYLGLGHLAHTAGLNPLNACILSILGGWFGTAVFDIAGKRLNLPLPKTPPR